MKDNPKQLEILLFLLGMHAAGIYVKMTDGANLNQMRGTFLPRAAKIKGSGARQVLAS